jgi:hypothetical protein
MLTHYTVGIAVTIVAVVMVAIILFGARSPHGHDDHH